MPVRLSRLRLRRPAAAALTAMTALAVTATLAPPIMARGRTRRGRLRPRVWWPGQPCPRTISRPDPSRGPWPRRPAGQRPDRSLRRAGHPRLLRRGGQRRTAPSGPCPTTASAPRRTPRTSCCGSTWSSRSGSVAAAAPGSDPDPALPRRCPTRDHKIDFPIVNENTRARLLTGGDFDIESLQRMPDGSFWIGEEFGPFLLHVDRRGRVLSAPVAVPAAASRHRTRPLGSDRRRTYPAQRRIRGDGPVPERPLPLPDRGEGAWSTTPTRGGGSSPSSTPAPSATPGAPGPTGSTPTPTWSPTRS